MATLTSDILSLAEKCEGRLDGCSAESRKLSFGDSSTDTTGSDKQDVEECGQDLLDKDGFIRGVSETCEDLLDKDGFVQSFTETSAGESLKVGALDANFSRTASLQSDDLPVGAAPDDEGADVVRVIQSGGAGFSSDDDFDAHPGATEGISKELGYRPRRRSLMLAQARRPSQTLLGFDFDDLPLPTEDFSRTVSEMTADEPAAYNAPGVLLPGTVGDEVLKRALPEEAAEKAEDVRLAPLQPLPHQRRAVQKLPKPTTPGHRVAIVVNGSLGDVAPFVAVGLQLLALGHKVQVFTACNHTAFFKDHGLDAIPVCADTQAIMNGMGGIGKDLTTTFVEGGKVSQAWLAEHKELCKDTQGALRKFRPHVVIAGVQTLAMTFTYEAATKVPVLPIYLSYEGLCAFKDFATIEPSRPSFLCVSSFVQPRSLESPPRGFQHTPECVLYDVPRSEDLEEGGKLWELRKFLGSGKPPVAMGWGSMIPKGMQPIELLGLALRSLKAAGVRGVILGGWAALDRLALTLKEEGPDDLGKDGPELLAFAARDVCFVDAAPHEWLFPQCCSIVHHGGVGTWQAATRAGKPAVITPVFCDQFDHAAASEKLGTGINLKKPLQEVTPQELSFAITRVEAKAAAAEAIGKKMRSKVGERDVAMAVDEFVRARLRNIEERRRSMTK